MPQTKKTVGAQFVIRGNIRKWKIMYYYDRFPKGNGLLFGGSIWLDEIGGRNFEKTKIC